MHEAHHRGDLALLSVSIADNIFKSFDKKKHLENQLIIKCDNSYLIQHVNRKSVCINNIDNMLNLLLFVRYICAFSLISDKLL